jgi:hypothetical protein
VGIGTTRCKFGLFSKTHAPSAGILALGTIGCAKVIGLSRLAVLDVAAMFFRNPIFGHPKTHLVPTLNLGYDSFDCH